MTHPPWRVAIVDDDRAYTEMVSDVLAEEGFEVLSFRNSADARRLLPAARPDLVILDLWLEHPGSGLALATWLYEEPATRSIPLVICSGDTAQLRSNTRTTSLGTYTTLHKPFDLDELLDAVRRMLPSAPLLSGASY
ncbi:MAG: hypothetical protein RLZZ387_458 [Chloroflexota bacterium]